nr:PLP-dependent transferase [Sulfobacillus harzensis]
METRLVKVSERVWPDNPVSPPIYQTAAYSYRSLQQVERVLQGQEPGYTYTRGGGNPTTEELAQLMAALEEGEGSVITASGTGAMLAAILALAPTPTSIYVAREIYGGTVGLVRHVLEPLGYSFVWVDTHQPEALPKYWSHRGSGILIGETISNPRGRVSPWDAVIQAAHAHNVLVIIDNTFASPFHARPLNWGADLIVHSVTKFIGGHDDVILGAVVGSPKAIGRVQQLVDIMGVTPDPMASWLALRGARTLALRMERSSQNARKLAESLTSVSGIDQVDYPGLQFHPDYPIASRLLEHGFGAILAIHLAGGLEAVEHLVNRLHHVRLVTSLGDVSTSISHPVVASHRELTAEEKERVGIDEGTVRISVGIEHIDDLIEDFRQALA